MRNGQTTLDYVLLIGIVTAGIIVMLVYITRGREGNLRSQANQLSTEQYAPGNTKISNQESKNLESVSKSVTSTTVKHGNINEVNKALEDLRRSITMQWAEIYGLRESWEGLAISEALEGAAKVRNGKLTWQPPENGLKALSVAIIARQKNVKEDEKEADELEKEWDERTITKDQTTSTSEDTEEGKIKTHKQISETLGAL